MPIRISPDNNNDSSNGPSRNRGPGGGGNFGIGIIFQLIGLVFRYPKIGIPLLIIAGLFFWFRGCNGGGTSFGSDNGPSTGCEMDQSVYDSAFVFEPLSGEYNTLPEESSLLKFCPDVKNQGQQGSCVGWSSAYAARTILYARQTGKDPNTIAFSPSFLYNQIALDGCQGTYIYRAMETMAMDGALMFKDFGYNEDDCSKQPSDAQLGTAQQYTIKGYTRLSNDDDDYGVNMDAIKQFIAHGAPVVIGMQVGGSLYELDEEVWHPTDRDYDKSGFGGHAICVIGYDDNKEGGAFQIMNSWGKDWGRNGVFWVKYKDFAFFTDEAYGLHPMGSVEKPVSGPFSISFGLVKSDGSGAIALKQKQGNLFETTGKVAANTRFKIKVKNNYACYTYVLGMETDGSSYVLFPYTPKHSPYCGVTGTRVFPRNESLFPDEKGDTDYMAILVSRDPIDIVTINQQISQQPGKDYASRINAVLGDQMVEGVKFTGTEDISFETDPGKKNLMGVVIAVHK